MKRAFQVPMLALAVLAPFGDRTSGAAAPRTDPCAAATEPGQIGRASRGDGFVVDRCGRSWNDSGRLLPRAPRDRGPDAPDGDLPTDPVTIDFMTAHNYLAPEHQPGGPLSLMAFADTYTLSDGSHWESGAGTAFLSTASLRRVEVTGSTVRYFLTPPVEGVLYQQTDYDGGEHSAQGSLGRTGRLVLEAQLGSTTAVMRGTARLMTNDPTWYGEPRFNYYTAVVGTVVPFELTYTLENDTWTPDIFSRPFRYGNAGWVDFAHPVSTPPAADITISGPPRVPDEFTTQYKAIVTYLSGARREYMSGAGWSVDPPSLASIVNGRLTTGTLQTSQQPLTVRASFADGTHVIQAEKQVPCLADDPAEKPQSWPMFQANSRHTGYLPLSLDPAAFSLRWERNLGQGLALNPVAAGEGKVYATLRVYFSGLVHLFALRATDGETLWTRGFSGAFSVNPPSFAYGMVYVQTGNHANDTWLWSFDGASGERVFQSHHLAQWERYLAPTVFDGKVYVNGGYYGGLYAFEGYAGPQLWFDELPFIDNWTPAVQDNRVYAYLGGLFGDNRLTGAREVTVPDTRFVGYSIELAPVLGAQDDAIVINDGRLISFNLLAGRVRWQVRRAFSGQPSVAGDRIYAIDAGRLAVLDESTHADLWSWTPAAGALQGPMIVTDTHVLVSSADAVYAVDLATHQSVWSYPAAGQLALADGTLYIARQNGILTAISAPAAGVRGARSSN